MHKVRIIPTLLYKDNLVKGKMFKSWRVVGNLYQMIKLYNLREVDELIFLDIDANQKNKIQFDLIDEFADDCFVPLTIGGGIKSLQDIEQLLKVGADKVCINSTAVKDLDFVKKAVDKYGAQCIVISIDYKINKIHQTAEISYFIGEKKYWKIGIGSQAVKKGIEISKKKYKLKKLIAGCYNVNKGSIGVLKKNKFKKEALLKSHIFFEDRRIDQIIFGLVL
jgi:imidazole glycerol phosphate synthase subunit HisF